MPEFKKLELNDIKTIKPYFSLSKNKACDNTVGGTFIWRDYFGMEYAKYNENFIFKGNFENNTKVFAMPLGKNEAEIKDSLKQIENYCKNIKIPMIIYLAAEDDIKIIEKLYKNTEKIFESGWSDYLYKAQDLAFFAGRKYSGQRNHINYFKRTYENYDIKQFNPETIRETRAFFEKYIQKYETYYKNSPALAEETEKIFEIFDNFEIYGQSGIALYTNNAVIGFAIGEIASDTLFVHIEKADSNFRGAYQMLVNGFAKLHLNNSIEYINREDDAGDENLRISKMSYHPCDIIKKYTVKIKI